MDTKTQRRKREAAIKKIISALKDGRTLSLYNDREFEVAEMHTVFCMIRKKINAGLIPGYTMKDEWRTNEYGIRYKIYWLVKDAEN